MTAATPAADALCDYVNAPMVDEHIAQCAATAADLVAHYIGSAPVPDSIRTQAALEVGANLYQRRTHTRDTTNGLDVDGAPAFFRPALDPMTPAYPILRPYMPIGIA